MRKQTTALQPSSQHSNHTHEVRYPSSGVNVIVRCYSAEAALREWRWQQAQGRAAIMKAVGT